MIATPGRASHLWVGLAVAGPLLPLLVGLVARGAHPWVPTLDLALTELRVRDVGSTHSPLVGLPGRFGSLDRQGSHPGPISFYLLAPPYRLLGGTSFALQAATVAFHGAAVVTLVLVVARRAGTRCVLAVSLATVVLVSALGPNLFTEPWNPHLPVLWWPVFLAAAWAALDGDRAALPVLAVSGAICAQTHVSYLGPVGVLTTVVVGLSIARSRAEPARPGRRRWLVVTGLLLVGLWLPPAMDQLLREPGNGSLLVAHLLRPAEEPIGWSTGGRLVLERLDLWHLVQSATLDPGRLADSGPSAASPVRGAVTLVALAVLGGLTRPWQRTGPSRWAWVLTGASLGLALVSASRIVGVPWSYLLLLVWPVALLAGLAVMTTFARSWTRPTATAVLGALLVGAALRAGVAAGDAEPANPVVSRTVRALAPEVVKVLDQDRLHLVTWTDAIHLGGHGFGMVLELERRGIDVVVPTSFGTQFGRHRTAGSAVPDVRLVVATGAGIEAWRGQDGVEVLVELDVRTSEERAEAARTRRALVNALRAADREELIEVIDENLLQLVFEPALPPEATALVHRLDALGASAAVLVAPLGSEPSPPG